MMHPNATKSDLLLVVAAIAGLVYFVETYTQLYPDSTAGSMISKEEAEQRALQVVQSPGVSVPKNLALMDRSQTIRQDGTIIQYLQELYGLEASTKVMRSLEVFTWYISWNPKPEGSLRIGGGPDEDRSPSEDREMTEVRLDGHGHLTRFHSVPETDRKSLPSATEGQNLTLRPEGIPADSARVLALNFIRTFTAYDMSTFAETNVKRTGDNHDEAYRFTFSGMERPHGLEHFLNVDVQNGRIRLFESVWNLPPEFVPHKDRWLGRSQEIVSIILLILFSILTVIYFLRRFRSGAFDYRLGIFFGLVTAAAFSGMMILLIWDQNWLGLFLVVVFGGGWWALASGIIVAVSASLARDVWPEKYQTFEAIRRGRIINRYSGIGLVRGLLWSFTTLGAINLLLGILPGTTFVMDNNSQGKFETQGVVFLVFVGIFSALIHFHTYLLLVLSAVRRRWKNLHLIVTLGLLINLLSLPFMGPIGPISSRLAIGLLVATVSVFLLIRYDFLTLIVFGVVTYLVQEAYVFVVMNDAAQITWLVFTLVLVASVGVVGLLSREAGEDVLEYVPEYVRELETKQRMSREFEIARQIQTTFLCCKMPTSRSFQLATVCDPAYEVGGDYYDFIDFGHPDKKLGVIIGDVSGKGVSAAFYMTLIKGVMQTQATLTTESTRDTLIRANDIFYEHVERGKFISMIYAIFDFERRILKISRAGHNPVLIKQSAKQDAEPLLPKGIAIGLTRGKNFADELQEVEVTFARGDVFTFYTDGFSEAMNKHGDEFGEERLYELIQRHAGETPQQIMDAVRSEVSRFTGQTPQHDDMTMIVVKVT